MLAGYAAGIALVVVRLDNAWALYNGGTGPAPDDPLVHKMGLFWSHQTGRYNYDADVLTLPLPLLLVFECLVLFVGAAIGLLLARRAPVRLCYATLRDAPRSAPILASWREALRTMQTPIAWTIACGIVAGFTGAVIGDVYAMACTACHEYGLMYGRGLAAGHSAHAVFLSWDAPDVVLLIIGSVILPAATLVVFARRRLRADGPLSGWCGFCGYPLPTVGGEIRPGERRCPECGASATGPVRMGRRRILPWAELSAVAALALGIYYVSPWWVEAVVEWCFKR